MEFLSLGFILRETNLGALQSVSENENENECEEKKRVIMSAFAPILTLFFVDLIGEVLLSVVRTLCLVVELYGRFRVVWSSPRSRAFHFVTCTLRDNSECAAPCFVFILKQGESSTKCIKKARNFVPSFLCFTVAGTLRISNLFPDYYRIIFTHDFLFEELIKTSNV